MDERDEDFRAEWGDVASSTSLHTPPHAHIPLHPEEEEGLPPAAQETQAQQQETSTLANEAPSGPPLQHQKPLTFPTSFDGRTQTEARTLSLVAEAFDDPLRSPFMGTAAPLYHKESQDNPLMTAPPLYMHGEGVSALQSDSVQEPIEEKERVREDETVHAAETAFQSLSVESPFAALPDPMKQTEELEIPPRQQEEEARASTTSSVPFVDPLEVLKPVDPESNVNVNHCGFLEMVTTSCRVLTLEWGLRNLCPSL